MIYYVIVKDSVPIAVTKLWDRAVQYKAEWSTASSEAVIVPCTELETPKEEGERSKM